MSVTGTFYLPGNRDDWRYRAHTTRKGGNPGQQEGVGQVTDRGWRDYAHDEALPSYCLLESGLLMNLSVVGRGMQAKHMTTLSSRRNGTVVMGEAESQAVSRNFIELLNATAEMKSLGLDRSEELCVCIN